MSLRPLNVEIPRREGGVMFVQGDGRVGGIGLIEKMHRCLSQN